MVIEKLEADAVVKNTSNSVGYELAVGNKDIGVFEGRTVKVSDGNCTAQKKTGFGFWRYEETSQQSSSIGVGGGVLSTENKTNIAGLGEFSSKEEVRCCSGDGCCSYSINFCGEGCSVNSECLINTAKSTGNFFYMLFDCCLYSGSSCCKLIVDSLGD